MRKYIDLNTIYPASDLVSETYTITRVSLTHEEVLRTKTRDYVDGRSWLSRGLQADFEYMKLVTQHGNIMMSDTPMERYTNQDFINKANGDVLIFGLGLGLLYLVLKKNALYPLLKNRGFKANIRKAITDPNWETL